MKCTLPNIPELIGKFKGKQFITSLDMKGGYWHIPIKKEHRERTAFVFDGNLYEWNYLPFDPTNSPAFFQKTMNKIFAPFSDFVVVYLDDISIISDTLEDHIKHLKLVFNHLAAHGIRLRIDKCIFGVSETEYLDLL